MKEEGREKREILKTTGLQSVCKIISLHPVVYLEFIIRN